MSSNKRFTLKQVAAVCCFLLAVLVLGQPGAWDLGSYKFISTRSSPPLQYSLARSGGLGSYRFVSNVGGVAFGGVAVPRPELAGKNVLLRYDGDRPDGSRLLVQIGSDKLQTDLPDWMLVPIAKYAASEFDACVSLFGPETTDTQYDIVYHENFQDTLLGLRLMQADILLFNLNETWQLPKFNGRVILGAGESAPRTIDQNAAIQINNALTDAAFQSWVMTDEGEPITFYSDHGQLRIAGSPYYYFWKSNVEAIKQVQDALYQQALAANTTAEHNRIVNRINAMEPEVQGVTTLTDKLRSAQDALRRFNRPVYDAATKTMQYGAFFRYVRTHDPAAWSAFMDQMALVSIQPQIRTPTRWSRQP